MANLSTDKYTIKVEENRLDFYIIAGPSFLDIISRYTEVVGRPPLLPKWTLGDGTNAEVLGVIRPDRLGPNEATRGGSSYQGVLYHGWNVRWSDQNAIEARARDIRAKHIPCDLFHIDSQWQTIRGSFEWVSQIPDPKGMLDLLNSLHFKVRLWQRANIVYDDYALCNEAEEKGYLIKGPDGKPFISDRGPGPNVLVDFSNPDAVKWWQKKQEPMIKDGARAYKLDSASMGFGEAYPEVAEVKLYNGMTGRQLENYYGPLYVKTVWDGLKRALDGKRAVLAVYHAAYFAGGRYPYMALGDRTSQSQQKVRCRIALNYGLSGIPFWEGAEFSSFGLPLTDREHKIQLIPYTYTYWRKSHEAGLPIIRAMLLECQDDPETYEIDSQFFYGKEFLVAPVLDGLGDPLDQRFEEGNVWVKLYLPTGEWFNYWSKERYLGPGWRHVMARPGQEPTLVKGGAIIPKGPVLEYIEQKPLNPLTLEVYPCGESSFTMYEDDGETYAYESGSYSSTKFECLEKKDHIEIVVNPVKGQYPEMVKERAYRVNIFGVTKPAQITVNNTQVNQVTTENDLQKSKTAWYYSRAPKAGAVRELFIKIDNFRTNQKVTIILDGSVPVRYYF